MQTPFQFVVVQCVVKISLYCRIKRNRHALRRRIRPNKSLQLADELAIFNFCISTNRLSEQYFSLAAASGDATNSLESCRQDAGGPVGEAHSSPMKLSD